jgi:hypothetical protein
MALPSSGPLSINDIRVELAASSTNQSLGAFSGTAGFAAPNAISDFYGYSHITTGLTSVLDTVNLTSNSTTWQTYGLDLSNYIGWNVKVVIRYISGTNYTGDFQIGDGMLAGDTTWSFNSGTNSFQTSRADTSTYSNITWYDLADGTTALRWNRRNGSTPTPNTGVPSNSNNESGTYINYFYYAETSSPGYSNKNFWLRSPSVAINESNSDLAFYYGAYGSTVNQFQVYLDVQSTVGSVNLTQFSIDNSASYGNIIGACSLGNSTTLRNLWHNGSGTNPSVGDTIYQDSAGLYPYNAPNYWYVPAGVFAMGVNNSGVVINIASCLP